MSSDLANERLRATNIFMTPYHRNKQKNASSEVFIVKYNKSTRELLIFSSYSNNEWHLSSVVCNIKTVRQTGLYQQTRHLVSFKIRCSLNWRLLSVRYIKLKKPLGIRRRGRLIIEKMICPQATFIRNNVR